MAIQIFGTNKSFDTKKALMWFKERGITIQFVNLKTKEMSKGEFDSVVFSLTKKLGSKASAIEVLTDTSSKDYSTICYLEDEAKEDKLFENQKLLQLPIIRNGKNLATVGYKPTEWETWSK